MLQIYLFGQLRVFVDGVTYAFHGLPKTVPLWAYLLLQRKRPLQRQRLAFTFWPDASEEIAKANLRRHLHDLRRALPALPAGPWLLSEGDSVQWNPIAPYWLDVAEFERFSAAADTLAAAIPLYTGDLLPELYEDWIFFERERLRDLFFADLERLAIRHAAQGDLQAAIGYAGQIRRHDPLREDAARQLMALHYRAGDRSTALQEYRRIAQVLHDELDAPPMPETTALYESILRGETLPGSAARPVEVERAWSPPHNLPAQLTSFIGREAELAALNDLLCPTDARPPCRLLTLTGAGGSGKSRLAMETAAQVIETFPHGAWWVELAPLASGMLVARAVANALGMQIGPNQPPEEALADYLAGKKLLLALDNCEHLIDECARLAHLLLVRCPRLVILVTSRESLHVAGEQVWPVPTLPLPAPLPGGPVNEAALAALAANACIQLFTARAQAQQPAFRLTAANAQAVREICRRLDGIPLAIELAAAHVRTLPPAQIARRLDDRFGLLTTGSRVALPRQQTLRNLIAWSYDLLRPAEQALFRRLAVFDGGWDLAAMEATAVHDAPGLLYRLVDTSLASVDEAGRYAMLDTIRDYARARLVESGDYAREKDRHLAYFLALAERAAPELTGRDQIAWLDRLESEHDNLRAALAWGLEAVPHSPDPTPLERRRAGARLAAALWRLWYSRNHHAEGAHWLQQALQQAPDDLPASVRAELYTGAGTMAWQNGDFAAATRWHEAALAGYRQAEDQAGVAFAFNNLGVQAMALDRTDEALAFFTEGEALARATGSRQVLCCLLTGLACLYVTRLGQWAQTERYGLEGLALARALGDSATAVMSLVNLAEASIHTGDLAKAERFLEEALPLSLKTHDAYLIWGLWWGWGLLRWRQQRFADAVAAYRLAAEALARLPNQLYLTDTLDGLAAALARQCGPERSEQTARLFAAAETMRARGDIHSMNANAAELWAVRDQVVASLTPQALAAASAQAQAWSRDEVIAFALAAG